MRMRKILSLWLCLFLLLLPLSGCNGEEVSAPTESLPVTTTTTAAPRPITTHFDEATGTLTLSGDGEATDLYPRIWDEYPFFTKIKEDFTVKRLVIEEGITSVVNCFNDLMALTEIQFPSTLQFVEYSFMDCDALKTLVIPKTVKRILGDSFNYCSNLSDIEFQGSISISCDGDGSGFACLDALEEITIPEGSTLCGAFNKCNNIKKITLGANIRFHEPDSAAPRSHYYSFCGGDENTKCIVYAHKPLPTSVPIEEGVWGFGKIYKYKELVILD